MKIFALLLFSAFALACNAQSTISLEQAMEFRNSPDGIPDNVTYVKDINNRLNQFVGTWKGNFDGKSYEFRFVKREKYGRYTVEWNDIVGRASVSIGNSTVYNTLNELDDNKTYLWGYSIQNNVYTLNFIANIDCNDSGDLFIEVSPSNPNQMTLYFVRDIDILVDIEKKCPNYSSYVPLMPSKKMILVKQ
ncbi:DUF6705 family protein [Chryseobacterium sp. A301]